MISNLSLHSSSATTTLDISHASSSAANDSSLRIVCPWIEETLGFATTKFAVQLIADFILKYTTAAYALFEASQNPTRHYDDVSPIP